LDGFAIGGGLSTYVGVPPWEVSPWVTTGDPAVIAEQVRAQADLGITHVQLRPASRTLDEYLDQLTQFFADVVPLVG